MRISSSSFFVSLLCFAIGALPSTAFAGRFGGGGGGGRVGGGGGGGFHPSGGGGGGFHPPSNFGGGGGRPSMPSGNLNHFNGGGAAHGPYGGGGGGGRLPSNSLPLRPAPKNLGSGNRNSGSGTWTGPGGTTAKGGWTGGSYTGPHGAVVVGGGKGGSVTGPGGKTVAGGKGGAVVIGPNGNVHAGGGKGGAVVGPNGAAAGGSHGSINVGPNGAVAKGGRAGIATGPNGTIAGRGHAGVAVGPNGVVAGGGRAVAGIGANGAGYRGTRFVAGNTLVNQGFAVRQNFHYYNNFTPGWYTRNPGAWFAAGWATGAVWRACTWDNCMGYVGYPVETQAVYYNYGDTVTYQDGSVYYGDTAVATEEEYASQAATLATAGQQKDPKDSWQPLGVFAMTKGEETTSNDIFQLAINEDGIVRGNYYDAAADTSTALAGSLDKKTQRIAWTIGDAKSPVYETGLYNLTQDQTTMLVHLSDGETEQDNLFRIPEPDKTENAPAETK